MVDLYLYGVILAQDQSGKSLSYVEIHQDRVSSELSIFWTVLYPNQVLPD